jgi:hypothetical protein
MAVVETQAVDKLDSAEQLAEIQCLHYLLPTAEVPADLDTAQADQADQAAAAATVLEAITQPVQLVVALEQRDKAIAAVVEFNLVNMPPPVVVVLVQLAAMVPLAVILAELEVMGYLTAYLEQLIIMQVVAVEPLELVEPLAVVQEGLGVEVAVVAKVLDQGWEAKVVGLTEKLDQTVPAAA